MFISHLSRISCLVSFLPAFFYDSASHQECSMFSFPSVSLGVPLPSRPPAVWSCYHLLVLVFPPSPARFCHFPWGDDFCITLLLSVALPGLSWASSSSNSCSAHCIYCYFLPTPFVYLLHGPFSIFLVPGWQALLDEFVGCICMEPTSLLCISWVARMNQLLLTFLGTLSFLCFLLLRIRWVF